MGDLVSRLDEVAAGALVAAAAWHCLRYAGESGGPRLRIFLVLVGCGALTVAAVAGGARVLAPGRSLGIYPLALAVGTVGLLGTLAGLESRRRIVAVAWLAAGLAAAAVAPFSLRLPARGIAGVGVALALWAAARGAASDDGSRPRGRALVAWMLAFGWVMVWVAGAAYVQVADAAARRLVQPTPRLPPANLEAPGRFGWERVDFAATDGIPLVGWWMAGVRPAAVVICHGHGDNKGAYAPFMRWLYEVGWSAFAFDLRTHGESGGHVATLGVNEQRDLEAAIEITLARQRALPGGGAAPLVVFGYSLGGTISTAVVARDTRVSALVLEGTSPSPLRSLKRAATNTLGRATPLVLPTAYRLVRARTGAWIPSLQTRDAIGKISPRPLLIVHGRRDPLPRDLARELYAAAGEPKQFFEAPNSRHVDAFFDDFPAYTRVVGGFLDSVAPRSTGIAP